MMSVDIDHPLDPPRVHPIVVPGALGRSLGSHDPVLHIPL